jgi:hypothetical protein
MVLLIENNMESKMNNYIDTFLDGLSDEQILKYAELIFHAEADEDHWQDGELSYREGNIRKKRAVRKLVAHENKLGLDPTYSADVNGLKVLNDSTIDLSLELGNKATDRYLSITKEWSFSSFKQHGE